MGFAMVDVATGSAMAAGNPLPRGGGGQGGGILMQGRTDRHRILARKLRREMPDAERLVWARIRAHRLAGLHFRRQVPITGFIVDFVCRTAKLIVELDGGQHSQDAHRERDVRRDAALASAGYRVLRFDNPEVFSRLDDVIETIYQAATARLPAEDCKFDTIEGAPSLPSPATRERVPAETHPAARDDDRSED
jgi:very-short-patch-repair endonuclease